MEQLLRIYTQLQSRLYEMRRESGVEGLEVLAIALSLVLLAYLGYRVAGGEIREQAEGLVDRVLP